MKYYKFNFDMVLLNGLSIVLFIIFFIPTLLILGNMDVSMYVLVLCLLWMVLHELIHGLGFLVNKGVKSKNITFGALFEKGIFYCMCKQLINKKVILIALISPLVLIGFVTLGISYVIRDDVLAFLSVMNIAGAIGDIVMFIMILRMPKDIQYTDLNEPDSFILISSHDLSKYLIPGVKITEVGEYTDSMKATDYRKIVISKLSIIIFIAIGIMIIGKIIGRFL